MTYRLICEFRPAFIIPAYGRGTHTVRPHVRKGHWRVVACAQATPASAAIMRPVVVLRPSHHFPHTYLVVSSTQPRQPGSICSPRKILTAWQKYQRFMRESSEYERAFNEWAERGYERTPQAGPWA